MSKVTDAQTVDTLYLSEAFNSTTQPVVEYLEVLETISIQITGACAPPAIRKLTEAGNRNSKRSTVMSDEQVQLNHPNLEAWKRRVIYEIPRWAWKTDPYCEGMNEATHEYLLGLEGKDLEAS